MTDYFKTSLAMIFNSFDSGNADGKIDKKEAKMAQSLYDGKFVVTKGMTYKEFEEKNKAIFDAAYDEQRNFYSKDADELIKNNDIRKLKSKVRTSGTYFEFRDIPITFEDLKPFLDEKNLDKLQKAFTYIDERDKWEKRDGVNTRVTQPADGKIDAEWGIDTAFEGYFLYGLAQDGLAGNMVRGALEKHPEDFSVKDLEEILVAIYKFNCYYQDQNK